MCLCCKYYFLFGLMFFFFCSQPATQDEQKLVQNLNQEYSECIDFTVYDATYLKAKIVDDSCRADSIAESVYLNSIVDNKKVRIAYLNLYKSDGAFLYQLQYDPVKKAVKRVKHEYH